MNLSLRSRLQNSFLLVVALILGLTFLVFNFLDNLHTGIEVVYTDVQKTAALVDEVRLSTVSLVKYQRALISEKVQKEVLEKISELGALMFQQLSELDVMIHDLETKKTIAKMMSFLESMKLFLSRASSSRDSNATSTLIELSDKILDSFTEFQNQQFSQHEDKNRIMKQLLEETKEEMMLVLVLGLLTTVLLGLVIPSKISLPFKKIRDGLRELQSCNFDVSIYYNQKDEMGDIAVELNKLIENLKRFEELRTDRVAFENRKFNTLANLVKKPVLVANAEGKLLYLNNMSYSLLEVQSEDVLGKDITDNFFPSSVLHAFDLAIKRRAKIENEEVIVMQEEKEVFKGFANVIPVRGKDNSLDCYLMVMSQEVII